MSFKRGKDSTSEAQYKKILSPPADGFPFRMTAPAINPGTIQTVAFRICARRRRNGDNLKSGSTASLITSLRFFNLVE
jgi:hypothetical protein